MDGGVLLGGMVRLGYIYCKVTVSCFSDVNIYIYITND